MNIKFNKITSSGAAPTEGHFENAMVETSI